jgi:hypothetical protein
VSAEGPPPPEDDRRFVNNPFARALHPLKQKRSVGQWIALVLVSIFGAIVMGAAFVLPPVFAYGLVTRAHGRVGMIAAGVVVILLYLLLLVRMLKPKRK